MSYESALTDPEYSTPGKSRGLWDIFAHWHLLMLLLRKGIKTRYYGSVLGWVWSYIRPLAQFFMYYLVIGVLLGSDRNMDYFPVYLFTGIITVNLFSEALRNTTGAITDNASLVKKIYLPRELFPVSAIGQAIVHFLPQAAVLLIICLSLGWSPSWLELGYFFLAIAILLVFVLGLGLFFGAINVPLRDARNIVDLILMFSTWASPVLYSAFLVRDMAPAWLYHLYMVNPVTVAVELLHDVFWLPIAPGSERPEGLLINAAIGGGIAIVTLIIGQMTFRKMEGTFAQHL